MAGAGKENRKAHHGEKKHRHHPGKSGHSGREHPSSEELIRHVEERVRHGLSHHGLRDQVVVARVDQDVMTRLDQLVEAGIFQSRSEAAAVLLREAIQNRSKLFDKISEKVSEIAALKKSVGELARREFFEGLAREEPGQPQVESKGGKG